jgi:hypothetical protein
MILQWLDRNLDHPNRQRAIQQLLNMAQGNIDHLPTTLFISGIRQDPIQGPVAGGSFADVYHGHCRGQDVAIKRSRVFLSDDKMNKLCKACVFTIHPVDGVADQLALSVSIGKL